MRIFATILQRHAKAACTALALALAAMGVGTATAQNTVITPYSRYGYGILGDNATAAQKSMGGVGYAASSGRQTNVMNPASYAAIDTLTFLFDMGVAAVSQWQQEYDKSNHDFGGGLDYITLQVPIGRYMGASVGLLPYGSVGYSFGNAIDNGSVSRQGSGSINQLYLGIAGRPFRGFGVGANIAYLFGSTINDTYAVTSTTSTSLFERTLKVRDWYAEFGVQYHFYVSKRDRLSLGLVYAPAKDLHGDTYGVYYYASQENITPDTVGYTKLNGLYSLPEKWGAGISWTHNNKLTVAADYTYQPWSKAKYAALESFEQTNFADRWRVGAGLEYTPNIRGNYGQRIHYRLGGYYTHDYIMVRDNNVREYGVTLGFGLPVPGYKTTVNIGFEWKHRAANPDPLIKENYFNITLGLNFNEMWFRKSKIY